MTQQKDLTFKSSIDAIITIDASLKLEGEKTGAIAEGVGSAIGGIGVERFDLGYTTARATVRIPEDTYCFLSSACRVMLVSCFKLETVIIMQYNMVN